MERNKKRYSYSGPVTSFGRIISRKWEAETTAVSKSKAKSNLSFRYKKENGLLASAKIELPGEVEVM